MNAPKTVDTDSKVETTSRLQVEVPTGMKAGGDVCTCDGDGCCAEAGGGHFPQPKMQ